MNHVEPTADDLHVDQREREIALYLTSMIDHNVPITRDLIDHAEHQFTPYPRYLNPTHLDS